MDDDIYVLKHLSYFHLFSFIFAHPVYHNNNQCNKQTESWQLKLATLQGKDCLTWCYVFVPYFGDPRYIIGEWITMIWVRNSPRCKFLISKVERETELCNGINISAFIASDGICHFKASMIKSQLCHSWEQSHTFTIHYWQN